MNYRIARTAWLAAVFTCLSVTGGAAQGTNTLPTDLASKVSAAVTDIVSKPHVTSASVGFPSRAAWTPMRRSG